MYNHTTAVNFNGNQFYTLRVILLWPTRVNQELYIGRLRDVLIDRKIRHALDLRVIHVGGVRRTASNPSLAKESTDPVKRRSGLPRPVLMF
jgi:uncharacterized membrane protein